MDEHSGAGAGYVVVHQVVENEDTEAPEHFGQALEEIMDLLGIDSSDGLLTWYPGGL